jgi:hypothetical protein
MSKFLKGRFSVQQVFDALNYDYVLGDSDSEICVRLIDENVYSVIGRDSDGYVIFAAKQVGMLTGFVFPRAKLESNKQIRLTTGDKIEPAFVLRFLVDTGEELASISTIFAGLQNQIVDDGDTSSAQTAALGLQDYFRGVRKMTLRREVEIGLFGEMSFIFCSSDPNLMVNAWHSSPFSTYDFSLSNSRLEVKTSISPTRLHWLSSFQTIDSDLERLKYLSIYAPEAADGLGILQLKKLLESRLLPENFLIFNDKLSFYDFTNSHLVFDFSATRDSFKFIDAGKLPMISSSDPSIRQIRWQCSFANIPELDSFLPWEIDLS